MRFAYADPPYLGLAKLYPEHPEAHLWDDIETHKALVDRLTSDYSDGWALSLHSPSLKHILPLCPKDARVGAWVKPFASFKPGVGVAYAWEPVIFYGGRPRSRDQPTVRDWCAVNITLKKGLPGAKPEDFCQWVFSILNIQKGDTLDDLFPGTGIVTRALTRYMARLK